MAKAAPSGLGSLIGGGGGAGAPSKRLPWGARLGLGVACTFIAFILAGSVGAFLILGGTGFYVVWSWYREKGNVVDSIMNWVFLLALLATAFRGGILKAGDGVRDLGPSTSDVLTETVRSAWPDGGMQAPTIAPPTTAAPIALPEPAPVVVAAP